MEEEEEKDISFFFSHCRSNKHNSDKKMFLSFVWSSSQSDGTVCLSVTVQIYILNATFCQQRDIVNCHFIPYLEPSPTRPGTHQPCTLRINFYLLNNIRTRTVFLARSASNKLQLVKQEKKNLTGNGSLPLQCSVRSVCPL